MKNFYKNKYILGAIAVISIVTIFVLVIRGIGNNKENLGYSINLPEIYTHALSIQTVQGYNFSVTPALAKEVEKKEKKNITTYKDAYEKSDIIFTVSEGKLKEDILLKAPGHPFEFSFQLDIENFWYEVDSAGNFIFYPKNNNALQNYSFIIPVPYMVDAKGTRSSGSDLRSKITEDGQFIITLDEDWFASAQYPVTIDPTIQIQILNIHSSPQLGEDWRVQFTTLGKNDLKIIPETQATIDDDEFVSLACDGRILKPQILENDVIFYPNWQCEGVGEVVHFTNLAGKHTLRFEYAGQTAFAYNSDWWNASWSKRKKIMLDTTTTATTSALTNYPLPVQFNSTRIDYTNTKDNGEDIRFVDPDGTLLNYEIEKWSETGTSTVWVKVPTISANSASDYIYVYYGNTAASDNSTTTGVWDDNFVMVQHFDDTVGYHQDSTKYANHTTYQSGIINQGTYAGKLDGADNGNNLRMEIDNDTTLSGMAGLTLEGWIKMESFDAAGDMIYRKIHSVSPWNSYYLRIFNDQVMTFSVKDSSGTDYYVNGTTVLATSTWYYVVGSYNGSQAQIYINASPDDPTPASLTGNLYSSDSSLELAGANYPDTSFDEFRISDTARSLGWIQFSYCSMSDNCVSYTSSEESIDWWNSAWKYRRKISFNTTTSATSSDLVDFPAVVQLNSSRIDYDLVQNAGQDIRFIDGDEELPYEIEKWDEAGTSTVWVKVPQVDASSTADHIWMYYGNLTATDNSTTTGVWDNNYNLVMHLDETTGQHQDSTHYANNATTTNVTNQGITAGIVDGTSNFNNTTNEIDISDHSSLDIGPVMIDLWVKPSAFTHVYNFMIFKGNSAQANYALGANSSGYLCIFTTGNTCSTYLLNTNVWTHVVAEMTSDANTNIFINGVYNQSLADGYDVANNILLSVGNAYSYSRYFSGDIDEIRISSISRGANWYAFEYCNIKDTCSTYSARENYADTTWWNSEWTRRRKISFDTTTSATTTALTDFPAVVQFNSSRIDYNFTQSAGQDIRFVDADGFTPLSYEIEKWNESGTSTVWVKVPTIDKNSNADFIYVYYGNNFAQDAQNKNDVWTNNYIMVRHFGETSVSYLDSTYHNNNSNFDTYTTNGKIGNAASGTNMSLDVSNDTSLDGMDQLTLEAWVNLDNVYEDDYIFRKYHTVSPWDSYSLYQRAVNHVEFNVRDSTGSNYQAIGATPLATSTWYYLSGVYDGSNINVYINGNVDDSNPATISGGIYDSDNYLASPGYNYPDGNFDEFRISNIGRSADWIAFSYCNMNDDCTSYALEELASQPPVINSITLSADDQLNSTSTPLDLPFTFSIDWSDADQNEQVKVLICKTSVFATSSMTCSNGSWASSTTYTQVNPIALNYTPVITDLGTQNYYVFVCDDSYVCSNYTSGSFYVYAPVYRSMGYNNTSPVVYASSTGSTNNLTISGTTASFSIALPDNIGVGDAIQYDSDTNGSIDKIVFIHRRNSPSNYLIRPATGTTTPTAVTNDADWGIYRAYISIPNSEYGTENTGVNATVRNFDDFTAGTDLVASNRQWNIAMYADAVASTTAANFTDTWVTSEKNYLRLYTPVYEWEVGTSQRHHGYMTDRAFKIFQESTADNQRSITYSADYVWVDGLQFELWNRGGYLATYSLYPVSTAGKTWISNNIFRGDFSDPDVDYGAIKFTGSNVVLNIWNNIFYDYYNATSAQGQNALEINTSTTSGIIANNTCVRVSDYCYGGQLVNFHIINNIAQQIGDGFNSLNGFGTYTDFNISSNASDAPGSHSKNSTSVTFANPGVKDYRLHSSDNQAKDEGYDFSVDTTFAFTTDIEGEVRTGEWDIGADEIPLTTPIYIKGSTNVKGGLYVK